MELNTLSDICLNEIYNILINIKLESTDQSDDVANWICHLPIPILQELGKKIFGKYGEFPYENVYEEPNLYLIYKIFLKNGLSRTWLKEGHRVQKYTRVSPLINACKKGFAKIVRLLLNTHDVNLHHMEDKKPPIIWAILKGHLDVVKEFMTTLNNDNPDMKVDINVKTSDRLTPLTLAIDKSDVEIVKLLLQSDQVDRKKPGNYNSNQFPLELALSNLYNPKVQIELVQIIEMLLDDEKVDVNQSSCSIYTSFNSCIHLAAAKSVDQVKMLMKRKDLDLTLKNGKGQTAFHKAAESGNLPAVQFLYETKQFDINDKSKSDQSALHMASANDSLYVVNYLYSLPDIKTNETDSNGMTPFHLACECDKKNEVMKFFIDKIKTENDKEKLINVNIKNDKGYSPLLSIATDPVKLKLLLKTLDNKDPDRRCDVNAILGMWPNCDGGG